MEHGANWTTIVASGAIAMLISFSGSVLSYQNKDKELDIKLLNVALGILREDPDVSEIASVRGWAVDVINDVSEIQIPPNMKAELLSKRLAISPPQSSSMSEFGSWDMVERLMRIDANVPKLSKNIIACEEGGVAECAELNRLPNFPRFKRRYRSIWSDFVDHLRTFD
ncbi:MAG: hypothetical protein AAGK33_11125 [Pseudomonadota bacterium]